MTIQFMASSLYIITESPEDDQELRNFWRPVQNQGFIKAMLSLKALKKNPSLPVPASADSQQSLPFLGLQMHHSNLCLHLHMVIFLLCILSSSYKNTNHWTQGSEFLVRYEFGGDTSETTSGYYGENQANKHFNQPRVHIVMGCKHPTSSPKGFLVRKSPSSITTLYCYLQESI